VDDHLAETWAIHNRIKLYMPDAIPDAAMGATGRPAVLTRLLSLMVEISQLYHASWIDSIRQTTIGDLTLGFGFLWSELACDAVGIGLGVTLE
jgi:hypothetical protein